MGNYTHKRPLYEQKCAALTEADQSVCAFGLDFLDFHAKTFRTYTLLKNSI